MGLCFEKWIPESIGKNSEIYYVQLSKHKIIDSFWLEKIANL